MKRVTAILALAITLPGAWLARAGGDAGTARGATPIDDERAVVTAALSSYRNLLHGGTGIAFPEARRPILLHHETICPTPDRLRVRVSSPANHAGSRRYSTREVQRLIDGLRRLSARERTLEGGSWPGYRVARAAIGRCGPQYDAHRFTDAVAVSRVAAAKNGAVVYLEHSGGGAVYHAVRRGGRWEIDWHVELWACG